MVLLRNIHFMSILLCTLFIHSFSISTNGQFIEKPLRFAFITCTKNAKFFIPVKKGMQDAAEKMEVECVFMGTEDVDVAEQIKIMRRAIEEGYDGIALNIIDPVAFDDVISKAVEQGVAVVAFNVDDHATPNARLCAVNQNLFEAGKILAIHLLPRISKHSRILITMHDKGVSALEDRLRGEQEVLQQKEIEWTILITGNDASQGAEKIADVLRKNPDIRIILGTGQSDTEAAGLAIERYFPDRGYWSAGFDLSKETLRLIQKGYIHCTIDQQPYIQGFYPVVQLALYLRFGIEPTNIDAGASIIDQANVDEIIELTNKGYR